MIEQFQKLSTTNTMMTRNQTVAAATAATAATVITISNDPKDTVIYPSMFDRWRLPL